MNTCFKCEYCGKLFDTPLKCATHEEHCFCRNNRAVTLFADPGCPERGVTRKENEGGPILTRIGDRETNTAAKEVGRYAMLFEYRPDRVSEAKAYAMLREELHGRLTAALEEIQRLQRNVEKMFAEPPANCFNDYYTNEGTEDSK